MLFEVRVEVVVMPMMMTTITIIKLYKTLKRFVIFSDLDPGGGTSLYNVVIATAGKFKCHERVTASTKVQYHYWLLVITDGAD